MEWEDDIGLNIIVNPLEETKVRGGGGEMFLQILIDSLFFQKAAQSTNPHHIDTNVQEYEGTTLEEDEYDGHSHNDYSSEEDDDEDDEEDEEEEYYDQNQIHSRKHEHQLEWDDEVMEYGPKKV